MAERVVRIRSFAKINLDLRVLHKRADGYHELRTVFQTIGLADRITIRYQRAARTAISISGNVDIPNNLIVRAAEAVLTAGRRTGRVAFELDKRIPMGAGLGGGSSNAAAVLIALPVLAGLRLPPAELSQIGSRLGSDVPFFLYGGTAVGLGRGTELYPLPDAPSRHAVIVSPGIHVSTAEAYARLLRPVGQLTHGTPDSDTGSFEQFVWALARGGEWAGQCTNDFEAAVFALHPALKRIQAGLRRAGASPALMTGSGSSLAGLFDSLAAARAAAQVLARNGVRIDVTRLVERSRYRSAWRHDLAGHIQQDATWPPLSWYSKK